MKVFKHKTVLSEDGKVELINEYSTYVPSIDRSMNSASKIYSFAVNFLKLNKEPEEYLYMMCLNGRLNLLSIFEISHGTVNCSVASSREIFQKALLANAVCIVLVHNHPSGDPYPSYNDIAVTKQVKEAGQLMNIELIDHVIIGSNNYISLKEMQRI